MDPREVPIMSNPAEWPAQVLLTRVLDTDVSQRAGCLRLTDDAFRRTVGLTPSKGVRRDPVDVVLFVQKLRLEPCWCRRSTCVVVYGYHDMTFEGFLMVRYVDQTWDVDVEFVPSRCLFGVRLRGWLNLRRWCIRILVAEGECRRRLLSLRLWLKGYRWQIGPPSSGIPKPPGWAPDRQDS